MVKEVEKLANFVTGARYEQLTAEVVEALKIRTLDSFACAFGALDSPVIALLQAHLGDFGGSPLTTLIGLGKSSPDRAAFYNGALIRYLDFNDSFLAKHETCHPSDTISSVLAGCEYTNGTGKDFLLSLALAYQVQCRLSQVAPVRKKGFDHTVQGAYGAASGLSKALKLTSSQTAHAIAMAGVANNALRVTRTGALSHWKGLAFPNTAFHSTHAAFLALRGITGPLEIFEGNKGLMEAITGTFSIDWENEGFDLIEHTIIKKYNAEIHSQSTLEGVLELKQRYSIKPEAIERIDVEIFDVAYHIIGGGEEGEKKEIRTKEEADHSLPYMIAVALLDGMVTPAQYAPERIIRDDVQTLLKKISIQPLAAYSQRFPDEMPTHIRIVLGGSTSVEIEKSDYEGFFTKPMQRAHALDKYRQLSSKHVPQDLLQQIAEAIFSLETLDIRVLTNLLSQVRRR